jgi:hypothetical protein
MKKIALFFCFIFMLGISSAYAEMPYDYPNQPQGFRNISWGANLEKVKGMRKMYVSDEDSDIITYARDKDTLHIGAAKLDFIRYVSWQNKFSGVIISFKGYSNYQGLKETLFEKFKKGQEQHDAGGDSFKWYGKDTNINLEYNVVTREGSLMFYGNKIRAEEDAYRKKKAKEGAARDF